MFYINFSFSYHFIFLSTWSQLPCQIKFLKVITSARVCDYSGKFYIMISIEKKIMIIIIVTLLLLLLPLKRELTSVLPRMAGDQEADSTPMKSHRFQRCCFCREQCQYCCLSHPRNEFPFWNRWQESGKWQLCDALYCKNLTSSLPHRFWGSSRKLAFIFQDFWFSFWTSTASNTFLDLFFNQYLAPY